MFKPERYIFTKSNSSRRGPLVELNITAVNTPRTPAVSKRNEAIIGRFVFLFIEERQVFMIN
jgi:hypothetical protein